MPVVSVVAVVAENWCQLLGMTFAATARQRSLRIYPTSITFNVPPLTRGESETNRGLCKMNRKKPTLLFVLPSPFCLQESVEHIPAGFDSTENIVAGPHLKIIEHYFFLLKMVKNNTHLKVQIFERDFIICPNSNVIRKSCAPS